MWLVFFFVNDLIVFLIKYSFEGKRRKIKNYFVGMWALRVEIVGVRIDLGFFNLYFFKRGMVYFLIRL